MGDPGDRLYVLTKGCVEFFQGGQKINAMGKNDYFGEVSLLEGRARSRRTATAVAASDVSCLTLHREPFRELFPDAAHAVSVTLASWFYGDAASPAAASGGGGGGGGGIAHDELAPTLAARNAMRRRSVTFLDADALRRESSAAGGRRAKGALRRTLTSTPSLLRTHSATWGRSHRSRLGGLGDDDGQGGGGADWLFSTVQHALARVPTKASLSSSGGAGGVDSRRPSALKRTRSATWKQDSAGYFDFDV